MSQPQNPYASPFAPSQPPPLGVPPNLFAACPKCGARAGQKVTFTWWGGLVGPKLLSHVRCGNCRTTYNGKTGRSNLTAIIVYQVVVVVILLGLFAAVLAAAGVVALTQ